MILCREQVTAFWKNNSNPRIWQLPQPKLATPFNWGCSHFTTIPITLFPLSWEITLITMLGLWDAVLSYELFIVFYESYSRHTFPIFANKRLYSFSPFLVMNWLHKRLISRLSFIAGLLKLPLWLIGQVTFFMDFGIRNLPGLRALKLISLLF